MITLSRMEFDRLRVQELLDAGTAEDEAEAERLVEADYPKCTRQAIEELRFRGLDARPWRIECCCQDKTLSPPMVGGSRCWAKGHIDRLAEVLEAEGHLTIPALYRKELALDGTVEDEMQAWEAWAKREAKRFNRKARRQIRGVR